MSYDSSSYSDNKTYAQNITFRQKIIQENRLDALTLIQDWKWKTIYQIK